VLDDQCQAGDAGLLARLDVALQAPANKLFIFEPCKEWEYCDGLVLVIAPEIDSAAAAFHTQLRDEWIAHQIHVVDRITHEKKQELQDELDRVVKGDLAYFVEQKIVETVGEANANVCGHYWQLVEVLDTATHKFSNGKTIMVKYNYA